MKLIRQKNEMAILPIENFVINAIKNGCDEPHDKCKNRQVQHVVDHHDAEAVLLMVIVHSCEKRV